MSLDAALGRIAALDAWASGASPAAAVAATSGPPAAAPAVAAPAPGGFQAALASAMAPAPVAAAPGTYPHLTGDLDADPALLARLQALAAARGERWEVTSGLRTHAEQQALWDNRHSNPFPVAPPGTSLHHSGTAADVSVGGRPIQDVVPAAELLAAGLRPLAGDAVHVELA